MVNLLSGRRRARIDRWLAARGWRVKRLRGEEKFYLMGSYNPDIPLPDGALEALGGQPEGLRRLREAYASLDVPVTRPSMWDAKQLATDLALPWFRGDNVYVWQFRQLRSEAKIRHYLSLLAIRANDHLRLFDKLDEDGLFGCWLFNYVNHPRISRDLLDSINEINFLDQHTGLSKQPGLRVLDIGAGYGRLAYRMCSALENVAVYDCVDAIPESTFLCDYYLRFRGVEKARAVPLHQLDEQLHDRYDIALNIHSFSECPRAATRWWLQKIAQREIPWLLIVPNTPTELLSAEADGATLDFRADVEAAGYRLHLMQPVYPDDELRELIGVQDHFLLFKREAA